MRIRPAGDDFVASMLDGLVAAHPDVVARGPHPRVLVRATPKAPGFVGLAIANGSGHEPIAAGWVGPGLLDANGVGDVFVAPGPSTVAATIAAADRGAGVVLLVSNHQGDVLNAELGAEDARAEGHRVEVLLMGDDLATASPDQRASRRGGPGTMFTYKVLGAATEDGAGIDEVMALGRRMLGATSTLAVTLGGGTHVLDDSVLAGPDPGRVAIGAGVHGEGGTGSVAWQPANELVGGVVGRVLDDLPAPAAGAPSDDEVLLLVNGAGGTTLAELWVAAGIAIDVVERAGLRPFHPMVGSFVTTADTRGLSVSIARTDAEIRRRWIAPCRAPGFPQP